jgi:GPH family glycoside/pentoside/hexuronide:cation symporter
MVPGIIINLGLQACNLMFSSMMAEVCDEDEISTGLRREGAYVAVSTALNRTVGIALILVAGFMPYLAGYTDMSARPTEGQLIAMKWILIIVQGIAAVAALAFLWFYPITRHRAERTRSMLDERHRSATA